MRFRFKILIALILVSAIVAFFLLQNSGQPMAILLFEGYRTDMSQQKKASFTLTNPASIAVGYAVVKEAGGSNTFVIDGTLRNGQVISFQIPVSQTPARLVVFCHRESVLREHLDDLRATIGLPPATVTFDYTLIADPVRE